MSLSFVASAVQTGTSDGRFEEVAIESKEVEAVKKRQDHQPLFEQLRQKREDEEAKQEEMQRELMRGTRALNDEDVAHLDSVEKQRKERELHIQQQTDAELAAFRAAKFEQQTQALSQKDDDDDDSNDNSDKNKQAAVSATKSVGRPSIKATARLPKPVVKPKIIVKKRKIPSTSNSSTTDSTGKKPKSFQENNTANNATVDKDKKEDDGKSNGRGSLGGLLSGYGSSSDEDSD